MKSCPKCHCSHLALKIAQDIDADPKTGICDRCSMPESDEHILIGEVIKDNELVIEVDLSGYGGNLVDTLDSKSSGFGRESSSLSSRTIDKEIQDYLNSY